MTIPTSDSQVLEQLILVSLSDISSVSGRRKLKKEDLGQNADLPPVPMVSLGSKKIIDPKLLNPFTRKKNAAHTLCQSVGIRFMGGYAIPSDKVNDLIKGLNDIKSGFYAYKNEFLKADFTNWINSFDEKYRGILLRDAKIDLQYMDTQIQFGFTAIHITPYGNSIIQDGLVGQIKSLADEVYDEVASIAEGFLKNLNSSAFTQHTLNPLRDSANKLKSLSFIAPSVEGLYEYMTDVLKDVPLTGKVTGKTYNDILSLLNNLRDPDSAKSFIELLKKTEANADASLGLVGLNSLDNSFDVLAAPVVDDAASAAETTLVVTTESVALADTAIAHIDAFASAEVVDFDVIADLATDLPPAGPVADVVEVVSTIDVALVDSSEPTLNNTIVTQTPNSISDIIDDSLFAVSSPSANALSLSNIELVGVVNNLDSLTSEINEDEGVLFF